MIAPWDEHLDAWADAWIAVAGDSPKPSPPPPSQAAASPATPTTEPAAEPPPDVIRLSDGAKARRAKAEAEEIARIERIAGNDAGLRDLALQLGKLADPIEKTPREIAWWFRAEGNRHIANIIESYLEEGGPFGRLLEDIAEDLRETSEEHDVDARDGRLIVSPDAILKDDHGEYVLREDREGVSRRYIVRVSPIVDKDGDQVAVQIRDTDQARSEGEPLQGGDHLLSFHFTRLTEAAIREHWRHFGMLAKAPAPRPHGDRAHPPAPRLRRCPRPRPRCRGDARASAKRALEVAIREHQRAAKALEVDFDEHIERIARCRPATSPASPTPSLRAAPKARSCSRSPTSPPPTTSTPELDKPTPPEQAGLEEDGGVYSPFDAAIESALDRTLGDGSPA
ncbi:MAG: hypothetical protein IPK80_01315 [Nannocystis sp.]|nr:hypothetical protein [Nannocystis sp.]